MIILGNKRREAYTFEADVLVGFEEPAPGLVIGRFSFLFIPKCLAEQVLIPIVDKKRAEEVAG